MLVLHGECMESRRRGVPVRARAPPLRDLPAYWLEDAPPELAGLLPAVRGRPRRSLSGRFGQGRPCELLLELLGRLASEHELLALVLEDVHWADRSSRDLIEFLARNLRDGAPRSCC